MLETGFAMASPDIDSELQDRPYSGVAFKASHNAYIAEKPPLAVQLEWDQGTPSRGTCRGVELDLIQDADSWRWSVAHGGSYSNGAEHQLSSYLGQLRQWSLAQNQDHGPILVHLELKNTALADGQFPAAIDAYIGDALSGAHRSEEHTSELRHGYISYAVFCLKKKKKSNTTKIVQ